MMIKTMKKHYQSPSTAQLRLGHQQPLMALSLDDGKDVNVNPGEGHDGSDALTKDESFDFSWD